MLIRYGTDERGKPVKKALIYTKLEHGIVKDKIDADALKIIERLRGAGFAYGNGVYPDGLLHGIGMRRAETFAPVFQISGVFAGAFAQIVADEWGGDAPQGVVESGEQHFETVRKKFRLPILC